MKLIAYVDGSSLGNPGESGYGIILKDEKENTLETIGRYIGTATNNIAEYSGLLNCLKIARKYQSDSIKVFSDSLLMVNQLNGNYKVKNEGLKTIFSEIQNFLKKENVQLEIVYIPRDQNRDADRLARRAVRLQKDVSESHSNPRGRMGDRSFQQC
jgi:ribonuclease HI